MTVTTPQRPAALEPGDATFPSPRRLAVFGSVSAERPPRAVEAPPSAAREVLERVFAEITSRAPELARPVLDAAVRAGTIDGVERDELLGELAEPWSTTDSTQSQSDPAALAVLREALAAVRRAAPAIAEPLLAAAVDRGELTAEQQSRILTRLRMRAAGTLRPTFSN